MLADIPTLSAGDTSGENLVCHLIRGHCPLMRWHTRFSSKENSLLRQRELLVGDGECNLNDSDEILVESSRPGGGGWC